MTLSNNEYQALFYWFNEYKEKPVGYMKGSRIYITVYNDEIEPVKQLVFVCVDAPDEIKMEYIAQDNYHYPYEEYELEITSYGLCIYHTDYWVRPTHIKKFVEMTHFQYEKEIVL